MDTMFFMNNCLTLRDFSFFFEKTPKENYHKLVLNHWQLYQANFLLIKCVKG